jgi:hypothetical protein
MDKPFIGSEALREGVVANKHQLRTRFRVLYPDVYLAGDAPAILAQRTIGAWLWTRRQGVVVGAAAAAMYGTRWIADDIPVELIWSNARAPHGITTRRDRLASGETRLIGGLRATTLERTAFDTGRLTGGDDAIARLDALGNATRFDRDAVAALVRRHGDPPAYLDCCRLWTPTTLALSPRVRHGFDCCSFVQDFHDRKPKFRFSTTSAVAATSSIWVGKTS